MTAAVLDKVGGSMTAKELAELWEPLAAREPGLRPEGLDPADWWGNGALRPEHAAALWRDAAVRWLADRGYWIGFTGPHRTIKNQWAVGADDDPLVILWHAATLDHALAAALAVLDAAPQAEGGKNG